MILREETRIRIINISGFGAGDDRYSFAGVIRRLAPYAGEAQRSDPSVIQATLLNR